MILISHFLGHEPCTGFRTINRISNAPGALLSRITGFKIPEMKLSYKSNRLVNAITHFMVVRDLNVLFTRLRTEDLLISAEFDKFESLPKEAFKRICFERGIDIENS